MLPLYDNIRRRRIELKMSQQELAEKLGYTSRTSIAKIEAGKIDIPQSKVEAFAEVLQISPGALMGWTEPTNKALWKYASIEDDKIVYNIPGLVNGNEIAKSSLKEKDSPLPFDISPNLIYAANDALRFALWGGDSEIVDDEMIEDVKDFAKLLAEKKKRKMNKNE